MPIDANEAAPCRGIFVSLTHYEYLERCKNYVEQEGVIP